MLKINSKKMFTLKQSLWGSHIFGGPANHVGIIPPKTDIPIHLLLTLDLQDKKIPFSSDNLRYLPLYYPLKYGLGGASMQYEVLSDSKIRIIYMSDPLPDDDDRTYVKVDTFPKLRFKIDQEIDNDDNIDWFTITIGGKPTLDHESDTCLNKLCKHYKSDKETDLLCSLPPIKLKKPELWWEFENAYMLFYFWLCRGCNTIITSNRST